MSLEYEVQAIQVVAGVSTARSEEAQIYFDTSPDNIPHLMNPAELLLSAFAACLLKNVERFARYLNFAYEKAEVHIHGVREEPPPRMTSVRYRLTIWTDETDYRLDLLHRNLQKHGTIFNTLKACCAVSGHIAAIRSQPPSKD